MNSEQPFEVGERITIGSRSGIVRSITPSLWHARTTLVLQLRRDDFSTT
jgi:small-conductance mechanosensitive channel